MAANILKAFAASERIVEMHRAAAGKHEDVRHPMLAQRLGNGISDSHRLEESALALGEDFPAVFQHFDALFVLFLDQTVVLALVQKP